MKKNLALSSNWLTALALSVEEAAALIESLKVSRFKKHDIIQEKTPTQFSKLTSILTKIKSINKTDVLALVSSFDVRAFIHIKFQ